MKCNADFKYILKISTLKLEHKLQRRNYYIIITIQCVLTV